MKSKDSFESIAHTNFIKSCKNRQYYKKNTFYKKLLFPLCFRFDHNLKVDNEIVFLILKIN